MESFYDDGLARFEARRFFIKVALAFDEFKTGQVDVFALIEVIDLLVEQWYVDGAQ